MAAWQPDIEEHTTMSAHGRGEESHGVTRSRRDRRPGWLTPLLLGVAVLLLGACPGWAGEQAPSARTRVRLAVIPFTGPTAGAPEGFGEALAQAIRHGLSQIRAVRPVDS